MYALFYALGWQMEHRHTCASTNTLIQAGLLTLIFMPILAVLLFAAERVGNKEVSEKGFSTIRAFGLILFSYSLMFMLVYPGILSYDSPYQLMQVQSGEYSTHHPLLHTLMLRFFSDIRVVVGSFRSGIALYTIMQMVLLAFFFAQTCASISRFSGRKAAMASLVFFSIHPMHMVFSTIATKDVLFAGAFVWMMALTIEIAGQKQNIRWNWKCVALMISGVFSCLMRNNMIYAVAVWIVLMIVFGRRYMRRMIILAVSIFCLASGFNRILVWATEAEKGDMREMLSLPVQQIARLCDRAPQRIESDERAKIAAAFDAGIAWSDYEPTLSDPIKERMHTDRILEDATGYARLYMTLAKRCPDVFLDAAVELTSPFFYPYGRYDRVRLLIESQTNYERLYQAMWTGCLEESERFGTVKNWMTEHLWNDGASDIPVVRWLFNTGLMVWIMLFFVLREIYAGRYKRFIIYMLPVLLWGTYLLGPIMNGRYAYVFLSLLPVLAAYPRKEKMQNLR